MKILVIDDHAVLREGVRLLLSGFLEGNLLEASACKEALAIFREERPDLVILDINLPDQDGLHLLRQLLTEQPSARILVFSVHMTPLYVQNAMKTGAKGFVSKTATAAEFVKAVRAIANGGKYVGEGLATDLVVGALDRGLSGTALSTREIDIIKLLAAGKALGGVAEHLGISYKTVANTCTAIKKKLAVERTSDLIRIGIQMDAK